MIMLSSVICLPDPDDYIGVMLLLLFSPTINQSEVSILITDDSVHEPNAENFVARLALVTTNVNVQVSPDSATIQINDDDSKSSNQYVGFL